MRAGRRAVAGEDSVATGSLSSHPRDRKPLGGNMVPFTEGR